MNKLIVSTLLGLTVSLFTGAGFSYDNVSIENKTNLSGKFDIYYGPYGLMWS